MFDTHDRDHFFDLGVELKPSFFPALQLGQQSQIQESGKLNFYYTECHHFVSWLKVIFWGKILLVIYLCLNKRE